VPIVVGVIGGVALLLLALGGLRFAAMRAERKRAEEDWIRRGFRVAPERAPRGPLAKGLGQQPAASERSRSHKRRIPAFAGDLDLEANSGGLLRGRGDSDSAYGAESGRWRPDERRAPHEAARDAAADDTEESGKRKGRRARSAAPRQARDTEEAVEDDEDARGAPVRVAPRVGPRRGGYAASSANRSELSRWADSVGMADGFAALPRPPRALHAERGRSTEAAPRRKAPLHNTQ
jgi:hypothetical protein